MGTTEIFDLTKRFCPAKRATRLLLAVFLLPPTVALYPGPAAAPAPQANAQTAPSAPQAKAAPPIRVTTRMIEVSVVVTDGKGSTAAGLTQDDFSLFEDGRVQKLQFFSVVRNEAHAASGPPPARNTFSNRYEKQADSPTNVTVVLFDELNTDMANQLRARDHLLKFLEGMQPTDHVGIYVLGSSLRVLQDITDSPATLIAALKKNGARFTPELDASDASAKNTPHVEGSMPGVARMNGMLMQETLNRAAAAIGSRASTTLAALDAIGGHLARVPGRKNLVWVSGSFPFSVGFGSADGALDQNASSFSREVERVTRHLTDANVAVYPVDARGLIGIELDLQGTPHNRPSLATPDQADFSTMEVLADRTGGRAFYNTNDITTAIQRAFDDTKVTYILGYYPENSRWDGKFRAIKVKVNRDGMHVRARKGYFAQEVAGHTTRDMAGVLLSAAASPLDAATIGMTAVVSPPKAADEPTTEPALGLSLVIDAHDLLLAQDGDRWKGDIEIVVAEEDTAGRVHFRSEQRYALDYSQAAYTKIREKGIHEVRDVKVTPGTVSVQVFALDLSAGSVGSVRIPVAQYLPTKE